MIKDNQNYNDNVEPNTEFLNELKNKLPEYFSKDGKFDMDKFKNNLKDNNINELKDGYQLNFIGKDYARRQSGEKSTTVIVPDQDQNKGEGKDSKNLFFTGDNLEVLRHMQSLYSNAIDVIYIDPPYNTGNKDFTYPDNFEYSNKEMKQIFDLDDDNLEKLKSIQGNSSHSSWLSFMYPRLVLAKRLLSEDGCILISIDENEDFNLRIILNEIYGDNNFVGQVVRKTRSSTNDTSNGFNQQHESLYIYAKNIDKFRVTGEKKDFDMYSNPDNDPNGPWNNSNPSARSGSEKTMFEIKNPYTGKVDTPPKGRYWAFSQKSMKKWIDSGKFVFKKKHNPSERGFFIKKYVSELKSKNKQVDSLFAIDNKFMNQSATRYLRDELFDGQNLFTSPKPVEFIQKILKYTSKKDSVILDFFAGSATTAHAVMNLNFEDDGKRKFIMVQLPERTYTVNSSGKKIPTIGGKNAFDFGYMTVDELSMDRIKKSSKKIISNDNLFYKDFDGSFKHYTFIKPNDDLLNSINDFDINNVILFNDVYNRFSADSLEVKGKASAKDTILSTWMMDDGFLFNSEVKNIKLGDYSANIINNETIYLIDSGWNSECTKQLLNKIGNYEINVNTIVIFGYSFNIAEMKELEIGLKQLDMSINLLKRY